MSHPTTITTLPPQPASTRPQIALTTLFTPPPSCSQYVTYDGKTLWQGGVSQLGDPACYPASFSNIFLSYYSPGVCPYQWTSAGSYPHPAGTSNAFCCPTSYYLSTTSAATLLANFCFSLMTAPLTNVYLVSSLSRGPIPSNPNTITLSPNQVSSTTVYADVIQVEWRNVDTEVIDLMRLQTASATITSSSSASTGSSSQSFPTSTSPTSPTQVPSSSGLSSGAKIGIGIGVPIFVLAVAAIMALIFIARRRSAARRKTGDEPAEMDGKQSNGILTSKTYAEMPSNGGVGLAKEKDAYHWKQTSPVPPVEMDAAVIGEMPTKEDVAAELSVTKATSPSSRASPVSAGPRPWSYSNSPSSAGISSPGLGSLKR